MIGNKKLGMSGTAAMAAAMTMAGVGVLSGAGAGVGAILGTTSASKATRADASKNAPGKTVDQRKLSAAFNTNGSAPWRSRIKSRGWSVATDRRRAKKARNVAKNRAHST